ncbi:MAG TPA: hypothetical protein VEI50_00885 [Nitrospiraceae bacterium]|nr:hypothetical protein [Nitrospiraceae bacterium]
MSGLRKFVGPGRSLLCAVGLATVLGPGLCQGADSGDRPSIQYRIGAAGWFTEGTTKWAFNSSQAPFSNPTSQLTYKDVGTNIIDFTGQARFPNRVFVRVNGGYGGIGGGRLTDNDYLAADGGQPSSSTHSNISGDSVWYVNSDLGFTLAYFPGRRGTFDVFIGYQYRREKHEANGLTQVVCTQAGQGVVCNPGSPSNYGTTVITNTQTWNSLRLGAQSEFRITRRFSIDGQAVFIPYASLNNKDIHHLRSDLAQDPSIEMTGSGVGTNLEGSARFMVTKGLSAHVGYRYWWTQVTNGNVTFFNADGTSSSINGGLTKFQNTRQGIFFGLDYTF